MAAEKVVSGGTQTGKTGGTPPRTAGLAGICGDPTMLTPQICVHREVYEEVSRRLAEHFGQREELTLAEFRDQLGTSRKYALALLEYWDKNKVLEDQGAHQHPSTPICAFILLYFHKLSNYKPLLIDFFYKAGRYKAGKGGAYFFSRHTVSDNHSLNCSIQIYRWASIMQDEGETPA